MKHHCAISQKKNLFHVFVILSLDVKKAPAKCRGPFLEHNRNYFTSIILCVEL